MTSDDDFIDTLRWLTIKKQWAALIALRSGNLLQMIPYLSEHLTDIEDDRATDARVLVAYLLGLQLSTEWFNANDTNFGASIKQLKRELTPPDNPESDPYAIERRFMALLDDDGDYLKRQLEYFVRMFALHDIGIDWLQLLTDLQNWNADEKTVQRKWSKSFWSSNTASEMGKKGGSKSRGGGRPRKYESDAERQNAYRERRRKNT